MFSRKSQIKTAQLTDEERWMNTRHTLYLKSRVECVRIRGRDIECCWVDNNGYKLYVEVPADPILKRGKITYDDNYYNTCDFMIRTKSGKEFSLRFEDWLKVMHEDENYK
jgi:hypothetical protein